MNKISIGLLSIFIISCATIDVEHQMLQSVEIENEKIYVEKSNEVIEKSVSREYINPEIIKVKDEIYLVKAPEAKEKINPVKESMKEASVEPFNYIGGTHIFDYNEHKQFPVVTKVLGMTVIQLEAGEEVQGVPFLSDSIRWEITGEKWVTNGVATQLIMLKPLEKNLYTNLLIVTNKRLYQFVLSSTSDMYMPMVKFRYPMEWNNYSKSVLKTDIENVNSIELNDDRYISYNYTVRDSFWSKKPQWFPNKVYDDGMKTYIELPYDVLQAQYPVVFENKNDIINYRVSGNIIILDKLIKSATMKLNKEKVFIKKKKGEPLNINNKKRNIINEYVPSLRSTSQIGGYTIVIEGEKPDWAPQKAYKYENTIFITLGRPLTESESLIISENDLEVKYSINGNIIMIESNESNTLKMNINNDTILLEYING